jgi:hypothetical protein
MQCPGSYTPADKVRDQVVIERSGGRYAVGTCQVCLRRSSVMRPTAKRPGLEFGRHEIAASRMNRVRIDTAKTVNPSCRECGKLLTNNDMDLEQAGEDGVYLHQACNDRLAKVAKPLEQGSLF